MESDNFAGNKCANGVKIKNLSATNLICILGAPKLFSPIEGLPKLRTFLQEDCCIYVIIFFSSHFGKWCDECFSLF